MSARAESAKLGRLILPGLLIAAGLHFATASSAATKLVDPTVVASSVAGKAITVSIDPHGPGTWTGSAFVGDNKVFLGEEAYRDAERGGGVGLFLLLHETGHTTGIADEHGADCFSLTHIKTVVREFWHLPLARIDQRYRDALAWPGKYDGNRCSFARGATR